MGRGEFRLRQDRRACRCEGVTLGEINPVHIPESNMVADIFTKYVKVAVWLRHLAYLLNDAVRAVADVVW